MKLIITHLYYDLLNLYGESGNVKALKTILEEQGIEVIVEFKTITDDFDFDQTNLIYMGAGTEENQKIVLKHMLKQKEAFIKAKEKGTFFLITGNAIELFGSSLTQERKKTKALNFFNYTSTEEPFRIVDEALFKCNLINDYILGFQNQNRVIKNNKQNPLFEVVKGTGSYPHSKVEGIKEGNFYGSYLIGPLLVRNPSFLKYLIEQLVHYYNPDYQLKEFSLELEMNAYQTFLDNYYKEYVVK